MASSQSSSSGSSTLTRCHVCSKHFRLRPDGALVRHGGKVKGSECSGSLAKPKTGSKRASLGNVSGCAPAANAVGNVSISSAAPQQVSKIDMAERFFRKSASFCLMDHIPKHSRTKFGQTLAKVVREIIDKPSISISWLKLLFLPAMILRKSHRGGRRHNPTGLINQRIDNFGGQSVEKMADCLEFVNKLENKKSAESKLISSVKSKIEKGNIKNAMQLLSSTDTVAPDTEETIRALKSKHPTAPNNKQQSPSKESSSLCVTSQQVLVCLKTFPKGTSGGSDGLTPEHLKDLTSSKTDSIDLINSITAFINMILNGDCPPDVAPYFFGGRLGTLPICVGGLGLGSAAELAPSAFLASAAATVALQDLMLPRDGIYVDNFRMQVYDMWRATNGDVVALENPSQKHWIAPCLNRSVDRWLQLNGSTFDKARIMAAGIPVIKEPMGLIEEGAFRPDGYTITPWAQGRSLAWDVTLPHTMADRYIGYTSVEAGTAALKASDFKNEKYVSLNNLSKIFQPICIETFGPTDKHTSLFINELTRKIVNITGDPNEGNYLKQTLSLLLQKFNSFCILDGAARYLTVRDQGHR
ncbi:hypothetical protein HELRODRAFT_172175 [Helobdella robusta]|uniref:Uncharacterized protein n=1 Tax=Helobdella robusta TaxID=6412 RepID=T1F543_HELRO|nr:hypothetical protein HELRODRAFT_172175 [Helobdella robusta]ESO04527.1 hypothetical protein HELRODRAFT_172175 [Helobdella robusta]